MKTKEEILKMSREEISDYKWDDDLDRKISYDYSYCGDCIDCSDCSNCTNCANCSNCSNCINCSNCSNCINCYNCSDCHRVANGLFCRNLNFEKRDFNEYWICNVRVTKKEYEKEKKKLGI